MLHRSLYSEILGSVRYINESSVGWLFYCSLFGTCHHAVSVNADNAISSWFADPMIYFGCKFFQYDDTHAIKRIDQRMTSAVVQMSRADGSA